MWRTPDGCLLALAQFRDNVVVAAAGPGSVDAMRNVCEPFNSVWKLPVLCPCMQKPGDPCNTKCMRQDLRALGICMHRAHGQGPGGATPRFWTPTTPPTNCRPEAPWGGGGGGGGGGARRGGVWEGVGFWEGGGGWEGRRGGRFPGGGGGCRAPPNSWVCGPGVIRQFAPPLPTIEGGVSSAWVFPATLGTSRGWAPEAAMGLELHHATRHTYIHTNIYIYIYTYIYIYIYIYIYVYIYIYIGVGTQLQKCGHSNSGRWPRTTPP